jgi:hypothetical protein
MGAGESKESAIKEIFSGFNELRKEPWPSLWKERALQYFFVFILVFFAGILFFGIPPLLGFDIVPTDLDNARYFLSAMVQAQASIITLVITLTLIAIQMASASYTPRVVDVMKKNPDMWYLLIIYIGAMSYGFIALKLVTDPDRFLVSSVLILGIYTFCILFLYMKDTIALLRPDNVVEMLVAEIHAENIHQEGWKKESEDDIMQPVFDMVHASINRFDVTTTRTGLNALSERILELFLGFDEKSREKKSENVAEHFCRHIQRSAMVALRNDDEGILWEIIAVLENFGTRTADKGDELEGATRSVAYALGAVGIRAADKDLGDATGRVAAALREVGTRAADKGLEDATRSVAYALGEVGTRAAHKGLEGSTRSVTDALGAVGNRAADNELVVATRSVAYALGEVGARAADEGLEGATKSVTDALREVGIRAADKELGDATGRVAAALGAVGTWAADKGLNGAMGSVAVALREIGIHAADKGLGDATAMVVGALCRLGLNASVQNAAAKSLAQLIFRHKSTITGSIKKFESELEPEQKDPFAAFMKKVNEELHALEPSKQSP